MKREEQQWFERWQNGDDRAFDALFRKFYKPLCYVAAIKTKDVHSAEDIVQDLFADIFSKRDTLEIVTSIDKYLYGALFFKCLNFNKKRNINHSLDELSFDPKDIMSIPSEKMEEIELEARIYEAIASLPDKCREIFELSRFKNKKNREIADMLNISIKTVETHMGIALKKLGSIFYEYLNMLIIDILYFFSKNI
ncbi:MAG: RNA polymerase sigma-70 factor [Bacteroidales bacterium]|nr:RNA polymerase sigma-70 factor [Bacteroidales bacterium]